MSIVGVIFLLVLGYLCSSDRKAISWRTVGGAFLIQVILAVFVLRTPLGVKALEWLTMRVSDLIGAGEEGISFLFGPLSDGGGGGGWIFAFKVLPVIIFFSSLIAVLYHLRIMQLVILLVGGGLRKVLGTSRAESFSAAANIFVGQTPCHYIHGGTQTATVTRTRPAPKGADIRYAAFSLSGMAA